MNSLSRTRHCTAMTQWNAQRGRGHAATQPCREGRHTARAATATAPGPQLQDFCDSGPVSGAHFRVGLVRPELAPVDLCVARIQAPALSQLQHWPGPKVISPGAHVHSFNKYLLCVCVTALFQALGLQEGINKQNPCMRGADILAR